MNRRCILYILLLCSSFQISSIFDSVPELISYIKHTKEDPGIDNTDWENPDYTSFYTSELPSFKSRVKSLLGFKQAVFDVNAFKEMLSRVTKRRKEKGYFNQFIQKVELINQGRLVVFGNIEGAFHSLVRSLSFLRTLDALSQSLILNDATYLVFNGNAINASAHNLETLQLILSLMQKNPDKVIYIRGKNEQNRDKEDSGIYRQLKIFAGEEADSIFESILDFFDTLPSALYVRRGDPEVLKISALPSGPFKDANLETFLLQKDGPTILHEDEIRKSSGKAKVEAIIEAYDYSRTLGLKRYIGPPTTWQIFSSPTGGHKRLDGFFRDAFVIIDSTIHFNDWLITLYLRDPQTEKGFEAVASYNLATGVFIAGNRIELFDAHEIQKFEAIIKEKQKKLEELKEACKNGSKIKAIESGKEQAQVKQVLRVGTSGDMSKMAKAINVAIKEALTKAFEQKNAEGGIHGVTFQYIFLNDESNTEVARKNYLKFVNDLHVDILLGCMGTATIQQSLDLLKENKLMLFFPAETESSIFRQAALKNIISLSVSYYEQGKALIDYLFKKQRPKKIALFYQNDDFGKDGLAGAKAALQKHGFKDVIELPYERNQMDFSSQIKAVETENPDAIGLFALPLAATGFLKLIGNLEASKKNFFGISDLRDENLLNYTKESGLSFTYASSLPDLQKSGLQIAENYKKFAIAKGITSDPLSFEGYVLAQIFFYLVEQTKGHVTKEKLMQAAEQIKNINFQGLNLNFNPASRELLDGLWIAQNNDEPWIKVTLKDGAQEKEVESQAAKESSLPLPKESKEDGVLTFGTSFDLSKTLKKPHESIKNTITKLFDEKNKSGGIRGLLVRDIFLDDAYTPALAHQNYEKLLNDMQVDMIFASRGTPTTKESLDFVKDGRMALLFPVGTETSIFRLPSLKNAISLTASFYDQANALVEMLFKTVVPTKIAFLFQNDDFGRDLLDGAKSALKKMNFVNIIEIPYERAQADFSKEAAILKQEKPDAIGLFGLPFSATELIKSAGALNLSGKVFFGSSTMREQDFLKFMQDKGLSFMYANSLPDWQTENLLIAQDYRLFASQNDLEPDSFGFEAYVVGELLFHLIEEISGPITKEKIIEAAEKIHDYDFKGLKLNFNPASRTLLNEVWIGKNNNEPWVEVKLASKQGPVATTKPSETNIAVADNKGESGKKKFELGASSDLSKAAKMLNLKTKTVISKLFEEKNDEGGIHNLIFRYTSLDDEYTPEIARKNFAKLLNELNVEVIFAPGGTATTKESLPFVKEGKAVLLFPIATNGSVFHAAGLKNVVNLTASYYEQGKVIADYILEHYPSKKVGLFYQDDDFGTDGLNGLLQRFKENKFTNYVEISFERNKTSFVTQKNLIEKERPEVLVFFSVPSSAIGFLRDIGTISQAKVELIGISDLFNLELMMFLKDRGLSMTFISSVPDAMHSDAEIAREFREFIQKEELPNDATVFEAFIAVKVFFYLIQQIEGPVTKEKIVQAAEQIKDLDFMGLRLNFDPKTRTLLNTVWIVPDGNKPWIEVSLGKPERETLPKNVVPEQIDSVKAISEEVKPEMKAEQAELKKPDEKAEPAQAVSEKTEESEETKPEKSDQQKTSEKPDTQNSDEKTSDEASPVSEKDADVPQDVTHELSQAELAALKKENEKPVAALHGDILLLGNTSDSTKGLQSMTSALREGMDLAIKQINGAGGIKDIRLQLSYLDDGYTPDVARKNIETLMKEYNTDLFMACVGTPTLESYIDLVKSGKITVFFPFTGASQFRNSSYKNLLFYSDSYDKIAVATTNYILKNYTQSRWVLLYQNDSFGIPPKDAVKDALEASGSKEILEISFERNDANFEEQVKKIDHFNADVIGIFGPAIAAQNFVSAAGVKALTGKIMYGLHWLGGNKLQTFLKEKGLRIIIPCVVPNPNADDLPIVSKFRNTMQSKNSALDVNALEGYINIKLFAHLLKKIEFPITVEKLMQVAENIKDYDFKGLKLNFDPNTRILSHDVWLDLGNGKEWIQLEVPKKLVVHQKHSEPKEIQVVPDENQDENKLEEVSVPETQNAQKPIGEISPAVKKADEKPVIALHDNILLLGNTSDSTKGLKSMTDAIREGMEAAIKEINNQGGVNNIQLRIDYLPDEYTPEIARKNIDTFLHDYKTDLFIGSVGTAPLAGYIDMVKDGTIAVFFPFAGSSDFRVADLSNIIHFTPSYAQTTGAATTYILENFSSKKWAILYQNDVFGTVLTAAMKALLKEKHIKDEDILAVPYDRNDVNFTKQVAEIMAFDPDVIGFYGPSVSAQGFIRVADAGKLSTKVLYGLSWLAGEKLQTFLKEKGLRMIIPSSLPDPKVSDLPLAQKFRAATAQSVVPQDVNAFEGYLDIALFAHMLKHVEKPITIEKLMQVAQNFKDYDFEGLKLNFNPNTRVLSNQVWLDLGDGKEWKHVEASSKESDNKISENGKENGVKVLKNEKKTEPSKSADVK